MSLLVTFVAFGLVGALIGAIAMIPIQRWWKNRKWRGCVEVWGINTATGNWERHRVKPNADTLPVKPDHSEAVDIPVNHAIGGQNSGRPTYLVDLASGTQLYVKPDKEVDRLGGVWTKRVVRNNIIPHLDGMHTAKGFGDNKGLVILVIALVALTLIGFIAIGVMINGIAGPGETVGNVVR